MDFNSTPEEEAFRREVREFLAHGFGRRRALVAVEPEVDRATEPGHAVGTLAQPVDVGSR